MTETKSDKLGLRGLLAHFDFGLRLIGGANATGAIAAGAAFHAFDGSVHVQSSVKGAGILFLLGIFAFVIAYTGWFMSVTEIDHSLHKADEPTWPDYLFWAPTKTTEEYKRAGKIALAVGLLVGLVSFTCFFVGITLLLMMAIFLEVQ
jgi:hypothetical protein